MANAWVELWNVTAIKAFMVIAAVLLGLNISPDIGFKLPWSIATIFYAMIIGIISVVGFVEMKFAMQDRGISGFNFGAGAAMVVAIAGVIFELILLGFNYAFTDQTLNRYYSWFLFLGGIMLFLQGREEFLHHKKLKSYLLGG